MMSCWLTLDDATRDNGAMQVIPGSHLTPAWHAKTETILIKSEGVDAAKAEVVELPAGGCMFHHCQTLHFTQPNTHRPSAGVLFIIHTSHDPGQYPRAGRQGDARGVQGIRSCRARSDEENC